MQAVEFQTFLLEEKIEIPKEFHGKLKVKVRVIVLKEENTDEEENYLDYLMENPIIDPNFVPLTRDEIYDRS